MENRFQHIFLKPGSLNSKRTSGVVMRMLASMFILATSAWADDGQASTQKNSDAFNINNEVFELGVAVGLINIADFNSEVTGGLSATFRASEDFFLQYNFLQAKASSSSYELSQGKWFDGSDRTFRHYDLLVGYNLYQGEFFASGSNARLSALYVVGGVGDTRFGGEDSFTYTLGLGYQVAITRRFIARVDYRSYIYSSTLIADEKKTVTSTQFSSGLSFLF